MNENKEKEQPDIKQICIIDNYPFGFPTDRISRIESILNNMIADIETKTIHFTQVKSETFDKYAGIILSGSSFNVSRFYFDSRIKGMFQPEIDLILQESHIPILGTCFGHQLIAYAFGAQVCRMRVSGLSQGIIFIRLDETDEIISKENIPVNVHHRDFISPNDIHIIENFKIKSISRTKGYQIIQYITHKQKPIYSVQFHPETHNAYYFHASLFDENIVDKTMSVGRKIIENFVWRCIYDDI